MELPTATPLIFSLLVACAGMVTATPPETQALRIGDLGTAIRNDVLVEAVGLETLGGVFTPVLEAGCRLPCARTEVFSTAVDDQSRISIATFRAPSPGLTRDAVALPPVALSGLPPGPRGAPQIRVTFTALVSGLWIEAVDAGGRRVTVELDTPIDTPPAP